MRFLRVRLQAPAPRLPELAAFYDGLGLRSVESADRVTSHLGETVLELEPAEGAPFYHVAFLVPGDRFEASLQWVRKHVRLLPDQETGGEVFDFTNWNAEACYFHDPAGNIVELIAHRGVGEAGTTGTFSGSELIGVSEVGLVGDSPVLAASLERNLGLAVWDGTVAGEGRLAFVGEKGRTLILCRAGRPWLPTGRPAEAHPVDVVLAGVSAGEVSLGASGVIRAVGDAP